MEKVLVWNAGGSLTRELVLSQASQLATHLPGDGCAVVNLCQDRRRFLLAFCAALLARRHTVLPPSPLPEVLDGLEASTGAAFRIDDHWVERRLAVSASAAGMSTPALPDDDFTAVTLYTSGSTGQSRAHARSWRQLRQGAHHLASALGLGMKPPHNLLATVPPQHMFGLETSILLPLLEGQAVAAGQPLFPEDVRVALAALPGPQGLITTPVHLRACLQDADGWPQPDIILSATAPLDIGLAHEAEQRLGAPVYEIYGSTETGALATRRPTRDEYWQPLGGVELSSDGEGWRARGEHFPEGLLADRLAPEADGRFQLLGRDSDLVKIAGKRHSIGALTALLQNAPGVRDGVMVAPGEGLSEQRLTGLAVLDGAGLSEVRGWLRQRVDPAFLPRPLLAVAQLPRTATGKLPRAALASLLQQLKER